MTSTSEQGHAKNVANLETLISFCTAYGTAYNPSNSSITLSGLNTLLADARTALQAVSTSKSALTAATNARQLAFEPLSKLATRNINALDAAGANEKLVKDARTISNKVQGRRASAKQKSADESEAAELKQISVSQQSFDMRIDNLSKLIHLLGTEPTYNPNEPELQITGLQATLANLKAVNTAVITAYTAYSNARINRDKILYLPIIGLADLALDVKKYVKSVYGASSPEYNQVSGISFRKRR